MIGSEGGRFRGLGQNVGVKKTSVLGKRLLASVLLPASSWQSGK